MKKIHFILLTLFFLSPFPDYGQVYKPYILSSENSGNLESVKNTLRENLIRQGLDLVGEYRPANDGNRWLMVVSSENLRSVIKKTGGLTGFAAVYRVALTREDNKIKISYNNPDYWGLAYFGEGYENIKEELAVCSRKLRTACRESGEFVGKEFGSEDGLKASDLVRYRYMMGMPRFENTIELGEFESYNAAIERIEKNLKKEVPNVKMVYSVEVPGEELKLYGFALSGDEGEEDFLPIIDILEPKHTAFLPYEFLVMGNQVHMLHGRYRIALSFPDLSMGTFTKIMSTPGNIEEMLESVLE